MLALQSKIEMVQKWAQLFIYHEIICSNPIKTVVGEQGGSRAAAE